MTKPTQLIVFVFFLGILFAGCHNNKKDQAINKVYKDICKRYSDLIQLGKGELLSEFYTRQISIQYEEQKLEIQVWKAKEKNYEPDYYIFLIHNNKYAGIPYFSNNFVDYWDFKNEPRLSIRDTIRTFEKEYNAMTQTLAPDSSLYISKKVIPFLNFYFEVAIINQQNIDLLDQRLLHSDFFKITEREQVCMNLQIQNFKEIKEILLNKNRLPFQVPIFDEINNRLVVPAYHCNGKEKKGWFEFDFYRFEVCQDPIPVIAM